MDIEKVFEDIGGVFLSPAYEIRSKLNSIKAFVFDWDGVFNDGYKTVETRSLFSEIDSMGINLIRFDRWLLNKTVPPAFILTGANNLTAIKFAEREDINVTFLNYKNKIVALDTIKEKYNIGPENLAFVFDDVLDLELARICKLSFFVKRNSNPLLNNYIEKNYLANYITGASGQSHAIREVCELFLGLNESFDKVLNKRIRFSEDYKKYLEERNQIETLVINYNKT